MYDVSNFVVSFTCSACNAGGKLQRLVLRSKRNRQIAVDGLAVIRAAQYQNHELTPATLHS